jgi:hypothetical protein
MINRKTENMKDGKHDIMLDGGRMKNTRIFVCTLLLTLIVCEALAAQVMERVEYISDSISRKEGKYIRLLGGSEWVLSSSTLALVADDVIIVFQEIEMQDKRKLKVAIAYLDGDEIVARHVGGQYVSDTGYLTRVVEVLGEGAVLKLADGSMLSIPEYDQYYTGWWLPPYNALLTGNRIYLWNLKKGKRVQVNSR